MSGRNALLLTVRFWGRLNNLGANWEAAMPTTRERRAFVAKWREMTALGATLRALRTTLPLDDLLALMVRRVVEIVPPADSGALLLYDPAAGQLVARATYPDETVSLAGPYDASEGIPGKVFLTGEAVLCDAAESPLDGGSGPRSLIGVRLIWKDAPTGVFLLANYRRPGRFRPDDRDLCQAFCDNLGTTLESARWAQERQRSTRRLGAVHAASQAFGALVEAHGPRAPVAERIAAAIEAGAGALLLVDPATDQLALALPNHGLAVDSVALASEAVVRAALRADQPLTVANDAVADLAARLGVAPLALAPLRAGQRPLGVFLVAERASPFTPVDLQVVTTLATQAALAIENARLFERLGRIEAVRQVDALQGEFLAHVSHELLTPLTAIRACAETLGRPDLALSSTVRAEVAADIVQAAEHLTRLVQGVLDGAKAAAGKLAPRLEPVPLAPLLSRLVRRFRLLYPERRFRLRLVGAPAALRADPDWLEEIVANLLANAVKYSFPPAPIAVSAHRSERGLEPLAAIRVTDRGLGIPAAELDRVFERFYRGEQTRSGALGGAGLGLYLCKTYAEAMGGWVEVSSAPGKGSTFTVYLPVAREETTRSQPRE